MILMNDIRLVWDYTPVLNPKRCIRAFMERRGSFSWGDLVEQYLVPKSSPTEWEAWVAAKVAGELPVTWRELNEDEQVKRFGEIFEVLEEAANMPKKPE